MKFLISFTLFAITVWATVSSDDCITIRGHVWCGAKPGAEHDGKVVFVQLVDGNNNFKHLSHYSKLSVNLC